jgi:predicted acetyltransferase
MNLELEKVSQMNRELFMNIWQYFGYDFSEMQGMDVDNSGKYKLPDDIEEYIDQSEYKSFVIKVDSRVAGVAVIKFLTDEETFYFRHFFIMRKYRHNGISQEAATKILDQYTGRWRVSQFDYNVIAIKFWRNLIHNYTKNDYREIRRIDDKGPQQEFISPISRI